MNWFKENPFLGALAAIAVVAGGVLGFFGFQFWTSYSLASESYTAAVTKLHSLQNKVPFPNEANLKTVQSALSDYSARIASLRSQMSKMEVPLDRTISPQVFQDGLRAAVNEIREKAAVNKVKLPENFYFGFDQYQTQVPTDAAAPFLHRQLVIIRALVDRLVDLKVTSLDGLVRLPLPEESAAPAAGKQQPAEKVFEKFPFEISFTAEQSKFRVAFNSLLANDQFLIVRSLGLQNSAPQAPVRGGTEVAKPAPDPFATAGTPTSEGAGGLQVILGRELVQATMRLEILDFTEPAAAKN
jgi:hypothetical protein